MSQTKKRKEINKSNDQIELLIQNSNISLNKAQEIIAKRLNLARSTVKSRWNKKVEVEIVDPIKKKTHGNTLLTDFEENLLIKTIIKFHQCSLSLTKIQLVNLLQHMLNKSNEWTKKSAGFNLLNRLLEKHKEINKKLSTKTTNHHSRRIQSIIPNIILEWGYKKHEEYNSTIPLSSQKSFIDVLNDFLESNNNEELSDIYHKYEKENEENKKKRKTNKIIDNRINRKKQKIDEQKEK